MDQEHILGLLKEIADGAESAVAAMNSFEFTKEPEGWYRHPYTGRRRPGGDPKKEYIAW